MVAGEAIGAIIAQDLDQEGRFDEDDKRLLMTLGSQVAVAIRNARLLESTYRQAARERLLYDITNKIRLSPNLAAILQTTARELSTALGARRANIQVGISPTPPPPAAGHAAPPRSGENGDQPQAKEPSDPPGAQP
jgi:GAF domain-containing protein